MSAGMSQDLPLLHEITSKMLTDDACRAADARAADARAADVHAVEGAGLELFRAGDYQAARSQFDQALSHEAENDGAFYWRGYASLMLGDWPAARRDLDAACRLNPNSKDSFFLRGMVLLMAAQAYEAALADFTHVIRLDPNAEAYYWRGIAFYRLQLFAPAIVDFTEAIVRQTGAGHYHYWRGLAAYQLQDYAASLADFDQALAHNPHDDGVRFWRGVALHRLGHHEVALAELEDSVAADPDNLLRIAWRGRISLHVGGWIQTLKDFGRIANSEEQNAQAAYVVAGSFAMLAQAEYTCSWLRLVARDDRELALAAADDLDFSSIHDTIPFKEFHAALQAAS